jgi:hypothetical protein
MSSRVSQTEVAYGKPKSNTRLKTNHEGICMYVVLLPVTLQEAVRESLFLWASVNITGTLNYHGLALYPAAQAGVLPPALAQDCKLLKEQIAKNVLHLSLSNEAFSALQQIKCYQLLVFRCVTLSLQVNRASGL